MKNSDLKYPIRIMLYLLLLAMIVGFFPWKYTDGSTCMADHWLGVSQSACHEPGDMICRYAHSYGLVWWAALGLIFYRIWIKRRKRST